MLQNKSSSYANVPTTQPEVLVAVATLAEHETLSSSYGKYGATVFDFDLESVRNNELSNRGGWAGWVGMLIFFVFYFLVILISDGQIEDDKYNIAIVLSLVTVFSIAVACFCGAFNSCLECGMGRQPDMHVTVTGDKVRLTVEPSDSGSQGVVIEIPFTDIVKVDVVVVSTINICHITTTSSDIAPYVIQGIPSTGMFKTVVKYVVTLKGLKEPYVFKKLLDSKICTISEQPTASMSGLVELVSRSLTSQTSDNSSVLLADIRDELKRHNDLLESHRIV